MVKVLLLLILLLTVTTAVSQEQVIQGKILNTVDVEGIHILNTSSRYNTVTNESGHFSIRAKVMDTLIFSSVTFIPEFAIITPAIIEKGVITITLKEMVNELGEVRLGPNLSGNLATDLKNIKAEKKMNFDDVGIDGFKGKPEEKIVPIVPYLGIASAVDIEALYKHLSGYYKKLRIQRKWDGQNGLVAEILEKYPETFFAEAYQLPINRLFDFLLFCIETTTLQQDFRINNSVSILAIFEEKSKIYLERLALEND